MYKVLCLNNISQKGLSRLTPEFSITEDISEADAIIVRSANLHDVEIPDNIKVIARAGAGYNNIPTATLAERGIPVFNTPGANANAVKELVICGMLLAARDVVGGIEWCKANADDENIAKSAETAKKQFAGTEIIEKTVGVIGLGAIGKLVVKSCEALGMKVYGYDPYLPEESAAAISESMVFTDKLEDIYANCNYITIHVPAMEGTIGMIDEAAINQMQDGVVFLNFSRDTLVDAAAMTEGLAKGKVGKYVTDFATPAVMGMTNTIVLPHLGASTAEAEENCAIIAVEDVMHFLKTGERRHCVNMK